MRQVHAGVGNLRTWKRTLHQCAMNLCAVKLTSENSNRSIPHVAIFYRVTFYAHRDFLCLDL